MLCIENIDKYRENYITLESFDSHKVICFGKNPSKVIEKAEKLGYKNPVIFYIQKKGIRNYF